MNRIQTISFCLLASALVLAGILVVRLDRVTTANTALADGQVIAQPNFSLMTARTRGADESLFVLDSSSGRMVVYRPNLGRQQLEVVQAFDMAEVFGAPGGGGRGGRGR